MTDQQIYRSLQQVARQKGRSTAETLMLYGLERVLARLQLTTYHEDFVLKGGVLLAAYALRRPTRDASASWNPTDYRWTNNKTDAPAAASPAGEPPATT